MTTLIDIISNTEGPLKAKGEIRKKACFYKKTGDSLPTLAISKIHAWEVPVLEYADKIKQKFLREGSVLGEGWQRIEVGMDDIAKLYEGTIDLENSTNGQTQQQESILGLIWEAMQKNASDIHFRNGGDECQIWMRVDGFLEKHRTIHAAEGERLCSTIYGSMCDICESTYVPRKAQDGRLAKTVLDQIQLYGARVATRPTDEGNVFVLRLLYSHGGAAKLDEIGYLPEQLHLVSRMTRRTTGINIFSGATGSGKSTSMKVLLTELVSVFNNQINLLTIEDPPEYVISGAVQTPVLYESDDPLHISNAWASSISNAMRLDPDVLMIGEMRDKASSIAAFRAAITGHGVWTTLHANSAVQILDRLKDIGVPIEFLTDASLISGLINQSLAPLNCEQCKRPIQNHWDQVDPTTKARLEANLQLDSVFLAGEDKNCPSCGGKGFKGRHVVAECIVPNQKFMDIYRASGSGEARRYWVNELSGITKCAHLKRLINMGLVDPLLGEQKVCPLDEDLALFGN